jgi:hypothetical protein
MEWDFRRSPPVVHWCAVCDEYLNIPVNADSNGHRKGECPYCGVMLWDIGCGAHSGRKGGEVKDDSGQQRL